MHEASQKNKTRLQEFQSHEHSIVNAMTGDPRMKVHATREGERSKSRCAVEKQARTYTNNNDMSKLKLQAG